MQARTVRQWVLVHTWTSLVCTIFLLILCITGLPLIFHHEIDDLYEGKPARETQAHSQKPASLDLGASNAQRQIPGYFIQAFFWNHDDPTELSFAMGPAPGSHPTLNRTLKVDALSGDVVSEPKTRERLTYFLLRIHTDLFVGLSGKLFLGVMGLLFLAATVSGVVVYGIAMRKLPFGTVRRDRSNSLDGLTCTICSAP